MITAISITAFIAIIVGYFIGANNPLSSVKAKIIDEAKKLSGGKL